MNELENNPLDSRVFQNEQDLLFFEKWLKINDSIFPVIVSREEYVKLDGKILDNIEKGGENKPDKYKLLLPDDLVYGELISIIGKIEKELNLGEYNNFNKTIELVKISICIALKNQQLNDDDLTDLGVKYGISEEYKDRIINQKIRLNENTKSYLKKVKNLKNKDDSLSISDIGEGLKNELDINFKLKTFFNRGKKTLSDYMMTFTLDDSEKLQNNINNSIIDEKKVIFGSMVEYDIIETKLREKLQIDLLKEKISNLGENDENYLLAAQKIIEEVYKYPWNDSTEESQNPSHVLNKKEVICLSKSILCHVFLEELGIKHYVLEIYNHCALLIKISNNEYYFDASVSNSMDDITGKEKTMKGKTTFFNNYCRSGKKLIYFKGDPEKTLISGLLLNNGLSSKDIELEKIFYEYAIKISPDGFTGYNHLGTIYHKKGSLDKAILEYEKSINNNPNFLDGLYNLGLAYFDKKDYKSAISFFDRILSINLYHRDVNFRMGLSLYKNNKSLDSVTFFKEAINIDPSKSEYWEYLGKSIAKIARKSKCEMCNFVSETINNPNSIISLFESGDKKKIRGYIKNKDYKGLSDYFFKNY